jgi:hypothetical protein
MIRDFSSNQHTENVTFSCNFDLNKAVSWVMSGYVSPRLLFSADVQNGQSRPTFSFCLFPRKSVSRGMHGFFSRLNGRLCTWMSQKSVLNWCNLQCFLYSIRYSFPCGLCTNDLVEKGYLFSILWHPRLFKCFILIMLCLDCVNKYSLSIITKAVSLKM